MEAHQNLIAKYAKVYIVYPVKPIHIMREKTVSNMGNPW